MKAKAAVFRGAGKPFEIQTFPLPEVEPGAVLARVKMTTICGSDLHTWQGKRKAPLPIILGHEIIGEIVEIGKGIKTDVTGSPLISGDRITWTIMANCGECYYCRKNMPQKCIHLYKYGHESCRTWPFLNGGLAEYIYLKPGTGILKIPEVLLDEEVVPINCALATVVNGLENVGIQPGDNVVIQGAGMLGINAGTLLRERGAGRIISLDRDEQRLELAKEFGADETVNTTRLKPTEILSLVKDLTNSYGADIVIEVSGNPEMIPQGMEMLRIGGKYLLIGTVFPNAGFTFDSYLVTTRMLTITGIHNYRVSHLIEGLDFVASVHKKYPLKNLVSHRFSLNEVDKAFNLSARQEAVRVAVCPCE